MHKGSPHLFIDLDVTFAEQLKALQLAIVLAQPVTGWLDGQAGGAVARQPQPVERPVLGWSRVSLAEQEAALVTNDAWSVSLDDGIWQWTLLRSPKMACYGPGEPEVYVGRDTYTDQGTHSFSFQLHLADAVAPETLATAARQAAQPPIVFDRYEGMGPRSLHGTWLGSGRPTEATA